MLTDKNFMLNRVIWVSANFDSNLVSRPKEDSPPRNFTTILLSVLLKSDCIISFIETYLPEFCTEDSLALSQ